MTLEQARNVLGLGPEEDAELHRDSLQKAREQLADLVRTAPNDTIAERYQENLLEFDKALAAVREESERKREDKVAAMLALVPGSVTGKRMETKRQDFHDDPPETVAEEDAEVSEAPAEIAVERGGGKGVRVALYTMIFLLIAGVGGGWLYFHIEAEREAQVREELQFLENLSGKLVEGRRWSEAELAFAKMEQLDPGSEIAVKGRRSIEVGMREERQQFVGYWKGEAQAAYEAGRLDDAAKAADKVIERYPRQIAVIELREKIESARVAQLREEWSEKVRLAVGKRNWEEAEEAMNALARELPGDEALGGLAEEIRAGRAQQEKDLARARELAAEAEAKDQGAFDPQVLEWMLEAVALAPEDEEIRALYEKIAAYSRTIRVPEDFGSLEEALKNARPKDRIVLGEGTFDGGVVINQSQQIEGAGEGKTVLKIRAEKAPALTFGPASSGSKISGMVFKHEAFDASADRYPAVQVRAGEVSFSDCEFREASGHGLEVMEGAQVEAVRCVFRVNGWNGFAARGEGSRMIARESRAEGNFGHGYEVWDGASATIQNSVAKANVRNGIHIDSAADGLLVASNQVFGNREYGILLGAGASGSVADNSIYANLMSGLLVRFASISVRVEKNRLEKNQGAGLLLEQGLRGDLYRGNTARQNRGGNVVSNARLTTAR